MVKQQDLKSTILMKHLLKKIDLWALMLLIAFCTWIYLQAERHVEVNLDPDHYAEGEA